MAGKQVRCPACKTIFRLPSTGGDKTYGLADEPPPPPVSTPPPTVPTMPMLPYSPYGAPYGPYYRPRTEGKSVASLVLGIVSLLPCWLYPFAGLISLVCGIVAIVLGRPQLAAASLYRISDNSRSLARAGMVCGIIGVALSSLMSVFWLIVFTAVFHAF
jgi:hypothetical protein